MMNLYRTTCRAPAAEKAALPRLRKDIVGQQLGLDSDQPSPHPGTQFLDIPKLFSHGNTYTVNGRNGSNIRVVLCHLEGVHRNVGLE